MRPDRWEHGSELHMVLPGTVQSLPPLPWQSHELRLFGSGRDALAALLRHGRATLGWQRLWLPDYFCQEVAHRLAAELPVTVYPCNPAQPLAAEEVLDRQGRGDVVVVVNHFGLRTQPSPMESRDFALVEDHTHDPFSPWALNSTADYAFASLRKTLPLPDGGVLWAPGACSLPIPSVLIQSREHAAYLRLTSMLMKALYLEGAPIAKTDFRRLAAASESELATGDISGMSDVSQAALAAAPWSDWREQRRLNHQAFRNALGRVGGVHLLEPDGTSAVPFACQVVFGSERDRDHARQHLIEARIYPAVLWPLEPSRVEGIGAEALDLSRRLLSLHCDFRYTPEDMARVAQVLTAG